MRRADWLEKTLTPGKIEDRRRRVRQRMRWHHWLNRLGFGWTPAVGDGQGGLVCYGSWGRRVGHDWVTELNAVRMPSSHMLKARQVFSSVPAESPAITWHTSDHFSTQQLRCQKWYQVKYRQVVLTHCETKLFMSKINDDVLSHRIFCLLLSNIKQRNLLTKQFSFCQGWY